MKTDRLPFLLDVLLGLAADEGARLLRRAASRLDGRYPQLRAEFWRGLYDERTRESLEARRELGVLSAGVRELTERLYRLKQERDALREALDAERAASAYLLSSHREEVRCLEENLREVAAFAPYADPGDEE